MESENTLSFRGIFKFWSPLWATWLMMAFEGPFLAAIIARLADPKVNLAAYGVAFSIAIIVEAPVIMLMSASTALARDRDSFGKMRRYTLALCALVTGVQLGLIFSPAFDFVALRLIRLPPEVAELTRVSLMILIPWPAAIGYRRFHQGLLIRANQTSRVAMGTVIRIVSMSLTGLILYARFDLNGAHVGACALSVGVVLESLATRAMARGAVAQLLARTGSAAPELSYSAINRFYYPLALTSTISLAAHPMITFFLGQSRFALESLAVFPVVTSLSFVFRSVGLSFQEVPIALMGEQNEHYPALRRFAIVIGSAAAVGLGLIALTPLCTVWFEDVSGLSPTLATFATTPIRILVAFPATAVLLAFQRGVLVKTGTTVPVTLSTVIEVFGIGAALYVGIALMDAIGATAGAAALLFGRILGTGYLVRPCYNALKKR